MPSTGIVPQRSLLETSLHSGGFKLADKSTTTTKKEKKEPRCRHCRRRRPFVLCMVRGAGCRVRRRRRRGAGAGAGCRVTFSWCRWSSRVVVPARAAHPFWMRKSS